MQFDNNGNLYPHEIIEIDLIAFEQIFIDGFTQSKTRRNIFDNYKRFVETIKQLIDEPFYQWIDGSFVTQKINPNDIDVLTFVPHESYIKHNSHFDMLRRWRHNKDFGVDGYFLKVLPSTHKDFQFYEFDSKDWLNTFSTGRKMENKGLIQINF
jgi:hypothetical protein